MVARHTPSSEHSLIITHHSLVCFFVLPVLCMHCRCCCCVFHQSVPPLPPSFPVQNTFILHYGTAVVLKGADHKKRTLLYDNSNTVLIEYCLLYTGYTPSHPPKVSYLSKRTQFSEEAPELSIVMVSLERTTSVFDTSKLFVQYQPKKYPGMRRDGGHNAFDTIFVSIFDIFLIFPSSIFRYNRYQNWIYI